MSRPLRWIKFAVFLAMLLPLWSMALPGLRTAAELLHRPYVESPQPLWPSLLAAAFCVGCAIRLVGDVAWDRRLSKALVTIWVVAAVLPPIAKAHAPSQIALQAPEQVGKLVLEMQRALQCELSHSGTLPVSPDTLRSQVEELLPRTNYRDRLGRRLPPTLRLHVDADGPVRHPHPGDPPGTLYVAIAPSGKVAWLSGALWGAEGLEPLRQSSAPYIAVVFPGGTASCPKPALALDAFVKPSVPNPPEVLPC